MVSSSKAGPVKRRSFLKYGTAALVTGLAGCSGDGGDGGGDGGDGGGDGGDGGVTGTTNEDLPLLRWGSSAGAELGTVAGLFAMPEFQQAIPSGVMPNVGEVYETSRTGTRGSAPAASAVGAGELDGASLAFSSAVNAIAEEVVPSGLMVVVPQVWTGPETSFNIPKASLADSGISSVEDIPGKALAVNAAGGTSDVAARIYLRRNGIDPENDVDIREVGFGAMETALREGRIDIGTFVQPLWESIQADAQVVFDQGDVFGNVINLFGAVSNEFLEENPDAMSAFIEDHWSATQWLTNPDNKEEAVEITSNVLDLPAETVNGAIPGSERAYYIGQDGYRMAGEYIQPGVDAMIETGYLEQEVNMDDYVTNEYIPEEANQFPPFVES